MIMCVSLILYVEKEVVGGPFYRLSINIAYTGSQMCLYHNIWTICSATANGMQF